MIEKHFLATSPLGFHRVAYTEWGTASDKPPVICVHGLMRNGRDFDRLAEALQTERQVFCPDIVGRGKSDYLADPKLYTNTLYAEHMIALIARTGAAQVDWVGTSMGGIIGMILASLPNTPIRRLVMNDIGPFIPASGLQRIGDYISKDPVFDRLDEAEKKLRVTCASFGLTSDEDWRDFTRNSCKILPNGKVKLNHDQGIAENFLANIKDFDLWALYDQITCPTLVLHGAESDILPAAVAEEMTQRGPKASLTVVPKTGHAPALMDATQIQVVRDFLTLPTL